MDGDQVIYAALQFARRRSKKKYEMKASKKIQIAREFFQGLKLDNWNETNDTLQPGGQAVVLIVQHKDGTKGVFRCLSDDNPKALDRFHRELQILLRPEFQSPSIISLLAYTVDEKPWYISSLGRSFEDYWDEQSKRLVTQTDQLVKLAIKHLVQILEGLSPLHMAGVVHRDIKPPNIVILESLDSLPRAALIDFGLAYIDNEPRVTSIEEAVGNQRYSPDQMMNRMDDIPPWLDVFQLSQVLIWMVSLRSAKEKWYRPLDWRWVKYDERLSIDLALALRAVTALCSEEKVSPRNADAMLKLFQEFFLSVFVTTSTGVSTLGVNLDRIKAGINRGKASQHIKMVEDRRVISACFPTMNTLYEKLRGRVKEIFPVLVERGIPVQEVMDSSLQDLYNRVLSSNLSTVDTTLYELEFGESKGESFRIRIHGIVYVPSLRVHSNVAWVPESSNLFALFIQRYANLSQGRVPFPSCAKILTLEQDGALFLRNENMGISMQVTISDVVHLIISWIEDEEAWEVINRDR